MRMRTGEDGFSTVVRLEEAKVKFCFRCPRCAPGHPSLLSPRSTGMLLAKRAGLVRRWATAATGSGIGVSKKKQNVKTKHHPVHTALVVRLVLKINKSIIKIKVSKPRMQKRCLSLFMHGFSNNRNGSVQCALKKNTTLFTLR